MKCDLCSKVIHSSDTAHGIKYGTADTNYNVFLPAKDSAWTVICSSCGDMLLKLIYSKLNSTGNTSITLPR